jgi:hypothetical protein
MLANAVHPDLGPRHHVPVLVSDQASHHTPVQGQTGFPPSPQKKNPRNPNAYSLTGVGRVGRKSNARSEESGQEKLNFLRTPKSVRKARKFSEKKCEVTKKCPEEPEVTGICQEESDVTGKNKKC